MDVFFRSSKKLDEITGFIFEGLHMEMLTRLVGKSVFH